MMSSNGNSADIAKRVAEVSGVRGIEPSIASTIQTLGARFGGNDDSARFGVVAHEDGAGYTVEVGLEQSRPLKEIVRDVQAAVLSEFSPGLSSSGASDMQEEGPSPQVHVRVQSVT